MSQSSAQSKFTFVNTCSSSQPKSARGAVFRHVQSYRRRKRQEDARRMLETSKFLQVSETTGGISATDHDPRPHFEPQLVLPPLMSVILLNADLRHFDAAPDVPAATFGSLIGFERDCVHPAMQRMEHKVTHSSFHFSEAWFRDTKAYLYDSLTVYSFLARISATMHMVTGSADWLKNAQIFRTKAILSLKGYLQDSGNIDIPRLYRALVSLMCAERALGDRKALEIHTEILREIVQAHNFSIISDPRFSLTDFLTIIYQDAQIAVLRLTRTFLDMRLNGWIDRHLQILWRGQSEERAKWSLRAAKMLHPWLDGELRELYTELIANMFMVTELRQKRHVPSSADTYMKYSCSGELLMGRLMNYYDSLQVDDLPGGSEYFIRHKKTQASACLCAVFWLREFLGIENVLLSDTLRIFTANAIILKKLEELVEPRSYNIGQLSDTRYDHLIDVDYWILFTGASIESNLQRSERQSLDLPAQSSGFAEALQAALRVGNISWEQCKMTLGAFVVLKHLGELTQFRPG